jgi:hypothetical protein
VEVVADRAALVLGHIEPRALQDGRFTHPILCRGPLELSDFLLKASDERDVRLRSDRPCAVLRELAETTAVERPARACARQALAVAQGAHGEEEGNAGALEPVRVVDAEIELHRSYLPAPAAGHFG